MKSKHIFKRIILFFIFTRGTIITTVGGTKTLRNTVFLLHCLRINSGKMLQIMETEGGSGTGAT